MRPRTRAPSVRASTSRSRLVHAGHLAWREQSAHHAIAYEAEEFVPPRRWVARITTPNLPYGGRWIYELEPAGAATRVTITERGEVYNPVFRFVSHFIIGHTATIDSYLEALAARAAASAPSAATSSDGSLIQGD
jgi:hypothetical protein